MRQSTPLFYDDFLKSLAFGNRSFETEEQLFEIIEKYVKSRYEHDLEREENDTNRFLYKVYYMDYEGEYPKLWITYLKEQIDAMEYARTDYINVMYEYLPKSSDEYRLANTNSSRRELESFLKKSSDEFLIQGNLKNVKYIGKYLTQEGEVFPREVM